MSKWWNGQPFVKKFQTLCNLDDPILFKLPAYGEHIYHKVLHSVFSTSMLPKAVEELDRLSYITVLNFDISSLTYYL